MQHYSIPRCVTPWKNTQMGISNMSKNHCTYLYWCKRNKHVPKQGKIDSISNPWKKSLVLSLRMFYSITSFLLASIHQMFRRGKIPKACFGSFISFFLFITVNPWAKYFLHGGHFYTDNTDTHRHMHSCTHTCTLDSHIPCQVQIQDCGNYWNVEIRNKIYINRTAEMFQLKGYIINPASYSPGYFSETNEDLCSSKNLYADVYRNFIILKNWKHPWFYFS